MTSEEQKELREWVSGWFPKNTQMSQREYQAVLQLVVDKVIELAENLTVENDNLNKTLERTKDALNMVIDKILDEA